MGDDSMYTTDSPTTAAEEENGNGCNESRGDVDAEGSNEMKCLEKDSQEMAINKEDTLGEQGSMTDIQGAPDFNSVERNKHDSSLLKLPAEVRMKIWGFATGGLIVEVSGIWRRVKTRRMLEQEECPRLKWYPPLCIMNREYLGAFSLLGKVCHQTRVEAHIAPYENNIFHFRSFSMFKRFVNGISQTQLEAIREISFGGPLGFRRDNFYDEGRYTPPELRKGVAGILPPNLKRIFFEQKEEWYSIPYGPFWILPYDIKEVRSLLGLAADQGPLGIKVLVLNVLDRKQCIENALQVFDI